MTARPKRQYRPDQKVQPFTTEQDLRIGYAAAPFNRAAQQADMKWGVDRLSELVSPTMADKYGFSLAKLHTAISAGIPEDVAAWAAVCMRGIAAMDAEATAAGHKPTPPDAWQCVVDGQPGVIIRDSHAWPLAQEAHPGLRIWTIEEVQNALAAYGPMVADVKRTFPGAVVTAIRKPTPLEVELDDFIEF